MRKKKARRVPSPRLFCLCRWLRQSHLRVLALAVPYGQGNFPLSGGSSVYSTSFLQTAACRAAFGFALQRNDSSDNSTSFREHFTHNGTLGNKVASPPRETIISQRDCIGTKRLRRIQLESRKQADVHGTLSPWHRSVLAFVFVSQICLFTLSEDPGEPGRTTEVSRR